MQLSQEVKTARAVAMAQLFAGGTLCLRAGGMPPECKSAATGQEIVSFALPEKMSVQGQSITVVAAPLRALALVNGTAGYWRIENAGKCVAQGSVGKTVPALVQVEQGQLIEIGSWLLSDTLVEGY